MSRTRPKWRTEWGKADLDREPESICQVAVGDARLIGPEYQGCMGVITW